MINIDSKSYDIVINNDSFYFKRTSWPGTPVDDLEKIEKVLREGLKLARQKTGYGAEMSFAELSFLLRKKAVEIYEKAPTQERDKLENRLIRINELTPRIFSDLPPELISLITDQLSPSDLNNLRLCNKNFREFAQDSYARNPDVYLSKELAKLDCYRLTPHIKKNSKGTIDIAATKLSLKSLSVEDLIDSRLNIVLRDSPFTKDYLLEVLKEKKEEFTQKSLINALQYNPDIRRFISDVQFDSVTTTDEWGRVELPKDQPDLSQNLATIKRVLHDNPEAIDTIYKDDYEWLSTQMEIAILQEDKETLALLLELDSHGRTYPLHLAAKNDSVEMVHFLLQKGFDPQQADLEGKTPYMYAMGDYDLENSDDDFMPMTWERKPQVSHDLVSILAY